MKLRDRPGLAAQPRCHIAGILPSGEHSISNDNGYSVANSTLSDPGVAAGSGSAFSPGANNERTPSLMP
jgi:hypothetical protein